MEKEIYLNNMMYLEESLQRQKEARKSRFALYVFGEIILIAILAVSMMNAAPLFFISLSVATTVLFGLVVLVQNKKSQKKIPYDEEQVYLPDNVTVKFKDIQFIHKKTKIEFQAYRRVSRTRWYFITEKEKIEFSNPVTEDDPSFLQFMIYVKKVNPMVEVKVINPGNEKTNLWL